MSNVAQRSTNAVQSPTNVAQRSTNVTSLEQAKQLLSEASYKSLRAAMEGIYFSKTPTLNEIFPALGMKVAVDTASATSAVPTHTPSTAQG